MSNIRIEIFAGENGSPDLVEIRRVGDFNTVLYKVSEKEDYLKENFPAEYASYKEGVRGKVRPKGTPLTELRGVGERKENVLIHQDVNTVEELADLSDASVSSLGAGTVDLRNKARDYIANREGMKPVQAVG
jgi:predicted flap endonuclease-1-like 5' DNA nuclease